MTGPCGIERYAEGSGLRSPGCAHARLGSGRMTQRGSDLEDPRKTRLPIAARRFQRQRAADRLVPGGTTRHDRHLHGQPMAGRGRAAPEPVDAFRQCNQQRRVRTPRVSPHRGRRSPAAQQVGGQAEAQPGQQQAIPSTAAVSPVTSQRMMSGALPRVVMGSAANSPRDAPGVFSRRPTGPPVLRLAGMRRGESPRASFIE